MLQEYEIKRALSDIILQDAKMESPGIIYEALCHAFILQKIEGKKPHALALQVLTRIAEFLSENKIPLALKKQILKYMDALGLLVADYEKSAFANAGKKVSGKDALDYLMQEHHLKQSDLKKTLGSQSIVSEILSGKRQLNAKQIRALAKRFGVSPIVFLDE